jgi:hypothetical protein
VREAHMPSDPEECREHAKDCLRWAMSSRTADDCERFEELATFWMRLAAEIESKQLDEFRSCGCLTRLG